jgi:hypothetical protein
MFEPFALSLLKCDARQQEQRQNQARLKQLKITTNNNNYSTYFYDAGHNFCEFI